VIVMAVAAFLLVWAGATLIIDDVLERRRRPDLTDGSARFQPAGLADEAQDWLRQQ
jgi:hypothetical protein